MDILEEYCSVPMASVPFKELAVDDPDTGDSTAPPREVVMVVGGEADGLSACAKKLAHSHLGERVYVPTRNGVESLNVASAASVVLFELADRLEERRNRREA